MKAIWTLEELKLPYERIDVGGSFGKTDTSDYRSMNPTGLVPTLQEDDFTLWESNAICRYLCHAHAPHSTMWPQEPHARANIDRWMDAQQTLLNRPMGVVFWGLVRTPADKRDMAAIKQAVEDTARVWGMVSEQLAKRVDVGGHPLGTASASLVQHGLRTPGGAASARLVRSAAAASGVQAARGGTGRLAGITRRELRPDAPSPCRPGW
jgi:glutathione S-transferase